MGPQGKAFGLPLIVFPEAQSQTLGLQNPAPLRVRRAQQPQGTSGVVGLLE